MRTKEHKVNWHSKDLDEIVGASDLQVLEKDTAQSEKLVADIKPFKDEFKSFKKGVLKTRRARDAADPTIKKKRPPVKPAATNDLSEEDAQLYLPSGHYKLHK